MKAKKEKETGAKACARSDRSVAAGLGRFRRHEEGDASEEKKKPAPKPAPVPPSPLLKILGEDQ
jgi:hypothetical protein